MSHPFKTPSEFANDDSGAVTVDWVVLTAAIVGLGIAVYGVVSGGISDLSGDINTQLRTDQIATSFPAPAPSLADLDMRVFTDTQKQTSATSMQDYDDATLAGMIANFQIAIDGQDTSTDPYAAMADSLDIAIYEQNRRAAG